MRIDTSDINSWKKVVAAILPLLLPTLSGIGSILLNTESWRVALAGIISGTTAALVAWLNKSPIVYEGLRTPVPMPPPSQSPHVRDLPKGPGTAILLIALGSVLALLFQPSTVSAATPPTKTSSSAPAYAHLELTLNANAAALHLDGSFGIGPALCAGWKLPVMYPIGCLSIEVARGPDGAFTGRLGPELGLALPGLQDLGLKTTPSLVFGWLLLRIGPGDFFDHTKGAYVVSGSFPFLGF